MLDELLIFPNNCQLVQYLAFPDWVRLGRRKTTYSRVWAEIPECWRIANNVHVFAKTEPGFDLFHARNFEVSLLEVDGMMWIDKKAVFVTEVGINST